VFFTVVSWVLAGGLVVYGLLQRTPHGGADDGVATPPGARVRIGAATPGQVVCIVGRIVDGGTLVAPITGRTCVTYDAAVIERPPDDGPRRVVARGVRGTPFVIADGTGKLLVDPRGAFSRVGSDHGVEVGAYSPTKVADPDFLPEVAPRADLRFDEGVLTIGERVAVTGVIGATGGPDDDPVYRRLATTALRLTGSPTASPISAVIVRLAAPSSRKSSPRFFISARTGRSALGSAMNRPPM